jgi:hypothetical protein
MTIGEWGAIGELIAAIATIATLIYLALQLRQNTATIELSEMRAVEADAKDSRSRIVQDKEVAELYIAGLTTPEMLDQADKLRFRMMLDQLFFEWQSQMYLLKGSTNTADYFIAKTLSAPRGRLYWEKAPRQIFQPEFIEHVDKIRDQIAS